MQWGTIYGHPCTRKIPILYLSLYNIIALNEQREKDSKWEAFVLAKERWYNCYKLLQSFWVHCFCALRLPVTGQGSTPLPFSLILLPILYVLLHTVFVTSRPSCLAWKGEEHWIQKTQTLTIKVLPVRFHKG